MGSRGVLVIGPDVKDQMARFRRFEETEWVDRHVVSVGALEQERKRWARSAADMNFQAYLRRYFGLRALSEGASPDLEDADKFGWMRVDRQGEVVELIRRTIPGGFWFPYWKVRPAFKLKLGRSADQTLGADDGRGFAGSADERPGFAASARKGDIDFTDADTRRELWSKSPIMDGKHIEDLLPEGQLDLVDCLPDETLITAVSCRC